MFDMTQTISGISLFLTERKYSDASTIFAANMYMYLQFSHLITTIMRFLGLDFSRLNL
jgi:hypothetical protein